MNRRARVVRSGALVDLTRPHARDETEFLGRVAASVELHVPWTYPPATAAQFAGYLARARRKDQRMFFVRMRDDADLVGVVNMSNIVLGNFDCAFLGYYGFAGMTGQGRMSEAVNLVVRHAFEDLGLHRLEANVQPGNERSLALVRRCGFRHEGFSPRYLRIGDGWKDHARWAITVEDLGV